MKVERETPIRVNNNMDLEKRVVIIKPKDKPKKK